MSNDTEQTNEALEKIEQQIVLTKINGVWQMDNYKGETLKVSIGKELIIALIDVQNPFAETLIDGPILGQQAQGLFLKTTREDDFAKHDCFNSKKEDILNVLENEGLVLAFTPNKIPKTEKLIEYVKENNLQLPEDY